jgi:hypothetical protein
MPIKSNTHTYIPIYVHTHAHPHTRTRTGETYKDKSLPFQAPRITTGPINPPPQALRVSTRHTNPNPHSPHQRTSLLPRVLSAPDQSTAPLLSLSHSSTSLRFSLAPMHSRAHSRSLSHPSPTYASSSFPGITYFDSVLPRTRARNRTPSRRRRATPDGRNSRTYDWRDSPALGPRDGKLAPFPSEFSEPPKEATEWETASSGYLRSCRSRFSSVSSGDSASSPGSPGEKTVPFCATWKGIFAHHPQPSLPPDPPAGVSPSVQRGWLPPPATSFLSREGPSVQCGRPLLSNSPPPVN